MAIVQCQIQKINIMNYANWLSDMKYLLMEKIVWDMTETETVPEIKADGKVTEKDKELSHSYKFSIVDYLFKCGVRF